MFQARSHIESGYIQGIIDPTLQGVFNVQSVWKIAEKAISCVQPHGIHRPTISEVLKDIQETISIERGSDSGEVNIDVMSTHSMRSAINIDAVDPAASGRDASFNDAVMLPMAR